MNNSTKIFLFFSFFLFSILNLFGEFNSKSSNFEYPNQLFEAVTNLNVEDVESILKLAKNDCSGAKEKFVEYVNKVDEDGFNVLHILAEQAFFSEGFVFDKDDKGNFISKKINQPNKEQLNNIIKIIKILLENGTDKWVINNDKLTPYHYLCFVDSDKTTLVFYEGSEEFKEIKKLLDISLNAVFSDLKTDFCTIL